jgi:protein SCO1/2
MKGLGRSKTNIGTWLGTALAICLAAAFARAHEQPASPVASDWRPPLLKSVRLEGKLGAGMPGPLRFRDESGATVALSHYFSGKPSILVFSYFDCPMLCPVVLEGLARSLKPLALRPGRDFDIIVVSIDERDGAAAAREKKSHAMSLYGRQDTSAGWHFLTGDPDSITQVTQAAGFRYAYDEKSGQYAHAAALYVLTPKGQIARIFYGVDFSSRDLRLALTEASEGRIGTPFDQLLLYCYHYDPSAGKYGVAIMNLLRIAGSATVLALAGFIVVMLRRDRRAGTAKGVEA